MKCKVCQADTEIAFNKTVLDKYGASYYFCERCEFLFVSNPFWLSEAYIEPINVSDTGIMQRNLSVSNTLVLLISMLFNRKASFLDYSGGFGILVRLMRDKGYDFYWRDKYTQNLLARGFEFVEDQKYELVTCIETMEHLDDPLQEIKNIASYSDNIFFTTELFHSCPPDAESWWYYGFEHGQHISFYSAKTLSYIAREMGLNFYTDGNSLHLFTKKKLNKYIFRMVNVLNKFGFHKILSSFLESLTEKDCARMKKK